MDVSELVAALLAELGEDPERVSSITIEPGLITVTRGYPVRTTPERQG